VENKGGHVLATNLYEAMFVVDAAKGGSEFTKVVRHIADLLTRHGAAIERIERWDERKLAYPIKHAKRGVYVLVYFQADGSAISEIRHTAGLSEQLLRLLILCADEPGPVKGQLLSPQGEPVARAEAEPAKPAGEAAPGPPAPEQVAQKAEA
jgi:ribosomal protein S6